MNYAVKQESLAGEAWSDPASIARQPSGALRGIGCSVPREVQSRLIQAAEEAQGHRRGDVHELHHLNALRLHAVGYRDTAATLDEDLHISRF